MEYCFLELTLFLSRTQKVFFFCGGTIMDYCLSAVFTVSNGAVQIKGTEFIYPVGAKWK